VHELQTLVGPPSGMNVRNVAWHGFWDDTLHKEAEHYYRLLGRHVVACSIRLNVDHVDFRATIPFEVSCVELQRTLPSLARSIYLSRFAPLGTHGLWHDALDAYTQEDHLCFLVSIVPLLEHALRVLWTRVNGLDAARCMAATSNEYFCILDTVLEQTIPLRLANGRNDTRNRLVDAVGSGAMDALMDLFVYPNGPRLRDRLAHGEYMHATVGLERVAMFMYALVAHFMGVETSWIVDYHAHYHPYTILCRQLKKCCIQLTTTRTCILDENECTVPLLVRKRMLWVEPDVGKLLSGVLHQITLVTSALLETMSTHIARLNDLQEKRQLTSRKRKQLAEWKALAPAILTRIQGILDGVVQWLITTSVESGTHTVFLQHLLWLEQSHGRIQVGEWKNCL
jgi:hypothetical protein